MTILRNFEIDDFEDQVKDIIKRFNSKDEFV